MLPEAPSALSHLIECCNSLSAEKLASDEHYFEKLYSGQSPKVLWIGCSDSRVVPEVFCKLDLGDIFVTRNVANSVNLDDHNSLSVVQYAVTVVGIREIVVCGHSDCGGVRGAINFESLSGDVATWVKPIHDIYVSNAEKFKDLKTELEKAALLAKLNVKRVIDNLNSLEYIKAAKASENGLQIHGLFFHLES
ncbi:hypothetical protein BB560_002236, partial [Smittium megazygosporum]